MQTKDEPRPDGNNNYSHETQLGNNHLIQHEPIFTSEVVGPSARRLLVFKATDPLALESLQAPSSHATPATPIGQNCYPALWGFLGRLIEQDDSFAFVAP